MIGDNADIKGRIKQLLPDKWFQDATPVLDSVLTGVSKALADAYGLTVYARLQTRINTATDQFLDLISQDFFGGTLPRRTNESDAAFRARIRAQLLLERQTRKGMAIALQTLTGRAPIIFEPWNVKDIGVYGKSYYGKAAYGSNLRYQVFITAFRPASQIGGSAVRRPSYNGATSTYTNLASVAATVSDQDILNLIDAVKPVGTVAWVNLQS